MGKLVVGDDFAESIQFAYAAADELRRLRTEIEDNDFLLHRNIILLYVNLGGANLRHVCRITKKLGINRAQEHKNCKKSHKKRKKNVNFIFDLKFLRNFVGENRELCTDGLDSSQKNSFINP